MSELIDWFGQPIQMEQPAPAAPTSPNPCVTLYGSDPQERQCKECAQLAAIAVGRTIYKCRLRKNTRSPRTDHRLRWPACAKFEQRTGEIPLYDGRS
jgi:hypothetical protein